MAAALLCAGLAGGARAQSLSPGLRLPASAAPGAAAPRLALYDSSRWAAHLDLMVTRSALDVDLATGQHLGWQLLGDYRFGPGLQLRATGGLFGSLGMTQRWLRPAQAELTDPVPRPSAGTASAPDLRSALPYLGVGWDTSTRFRHGWGGWGLSADLGLTAQRGDVNDLRLGNSSRGLGDSLGNWRLTPVVQVGLSYAF